MEEFKLPKFDAITILIAAYMMNMVHFRGIASVQQILVWILVLFYILKNNRYFFRIFSRCNKKNYIQITAIILGFYMLVVVGPILYAKDISYLKAVFSMILLFFYFMVIVIRLEKKFPERNLFDSFIFIYIYVTVIYVLVSALMIYIPPVKEFILGIIDIGEYNRHVLANPYYITRVGWTGFSGYNNSIKCSIACSLCLYILLRDYFYLNKNNLKIYILIGVCLLGNIFYARTGFIISLICIVISVFYIALWQHKVYTFFKYIFILSIAAIVGYNIIILQMEDNKSIQWAFEMIVNYFNGEGATSSSLSKLLNMYFLPPIGTLMFGDGRYMGIKGGYYMNTDAGVMRNILYFGIVGASFLYGNVIFQINELSLKSKKLKYNILPVLFLVLLIGYEFKGESTLLLLPTLIILNLISSDKNVKNN